jgi:hypothetical protein
MPRIVRPNQTQIKVVPRDGEIEITLNINITVDGEITASSEQAEVVAQKVKAEEDKVERVIPDFMSGMKLKFGKDK